MNVRLFHYVLFGFAFVYSLLNTRIDSVLFAVIQFGLAIYYTLRPEYTNADD